MTYDVDTIFTNEDTVVVGGKLGSAVEVVCGDCDVVTTTAVLLHDIA